jgi:hypothetical protein
VDVAEAQKKAGGDDNASAQPAKESHTQF